jgi:hypothetical protein
MKSKTLKLNNHWFLTFSTLDDSQQLEISTHHTVSTTCVDEITLLGAGADTSSIAAKRRTTALRLALVILEHKEIVRAYFNLWAIERLIWPRVTPITSIASL